VEITALKFSGVCKVLAVASAHGLVRLWDPVLGQCLRTFEGVSGRSLSFSVDGKYLRTGREILRLERRKILRLEPGPRFPIAKQHSNALYVNGAWVMRGGRRLLWLPPEYRSERPTAVHGNKLVLGCVRGQVTIWSSTFNTVSFICRSILNTQPVKLKSSLRPSLSITLKPLSRAYQRAIIGLKKLGIRGAVARRSSLRRAGYSRLWDPEARVSLTSTRHHGHSSIEVGMQNVVRRI
jgi:WD40 repeat protein